MSLICSACIPTRKRVPQLIKTIESILGARDDEDSVEILLRVDDDDDETISQLEVLRCRFGVKWHIGPRGSGYDNMGQFITELSDMAKAPWIFIIDDDATIHGRGLDTKLRTVPSGHVAVCEFYKLNHSVYRGALPVGMFVPNKCWNEYGRDKLCSPVDEFLRGLLVNDNKWGLSLLPNLTYFHEWGQDTQDRRSTFQNNP